MPARSVSTRPELDSSIMIIRASAAQSADAVRLIEEYQDAVGVLVRDSPAFIAASLDDPDKAVWLAYEGTEAVACVAMQWLSRLERSGEIKRLYVQPAYRGKQIAARLIAAVESFASQIGCTSLYLDSKDDLHAAKALYSRLGYEPCDRYNDNPQATVFMRKSLTRDPASPFVLRPFIPGDASAFCRLNEAWITELFRMEPSDHVVLNDPIGQILEPGGFIYMATRNDVPVACCALVAMGDQCFELSKMAVDSSQRGQGLGRALLEYVIAEARKLPVRRLYLETNSSLHNAIHLYEAMGFRHLPPQERGPAHYERGDVAMELFLPR